MEVQRGRPGRKATGRVRESNIQLRVTEEELEAAKSSARKNHTTVARMLREYLVATNQKEVEEFTVEVKGQPVTLSKYEANELLKQLIDALLK